MKNHRHRRLQDRLFLLVIISFIIFIPAISSALVAGQEPESAFNKIILVAQNEEDEGEGEDENEVEAPPAVTPPPVIRREPPVQPVPPAAPPVAAPPAEVKPQEGKGEAPGQPAPPPAEAGPSEVQEVIPVRPAPPKPERKPADVSFFFDDADVYEVIQTIFGEVLKVNYIVDPKIRGRVNFRTTTPIPKDEVLPVWR